MSDNEDYAIRVIIPNSDGTGSGVWEGTQNRFKNQYHASNPNDITGFNPFNNLLRGQYLNGYHWKRFDKDKRGKKLKKFTVRRSRGSDQKDRKVKLYEWRLVKDGDNDIDSSDSDRSSEDEVLLAEELNEHFAQDDDDDYEEYLKHRDGMLRNVLHYDADGRKEAQMKGNFSNDGSGFLPRENTSSSTTIGFGNDGSSSSFPQRKTNVLSVKKKRKKNTTSSGSISNDSKQQDYKKLYEKCDKERNIFLKELLLLREWVRDKDIGNTSPHPPGYEIWGPKDRELQGGRKSRKKRRKRRKRRKKTRKRK